MKLFSLYYHVYAVCFLKKVLYIAKVWYGIRVIFYLKFLSDLVGSFFIWQPRGQWGLINYCSILCIWSSLFNILFGLDFGSMYHALFCLEMLEESFPFIIYVWKEGLLSCLGENYDFFFIWENSSDMVQGYGQCSFFQWVYYLQHKPLFFNCHSKV